MSEYFDPDDIEGRHPRPPGHYRPGPNFDFPDRLRPPEYPFGSASRPNWQPGYVPSATEWQSWFSRKLDTDDTTLTGGPFMPLSGQQMQGPLMLARNPRHAMEACTKDYADSLTPAGGPFFPANGGEIRGDLNVLGNMQVAQQTALDGPLTINGQTQINNTLFVGQPAMFADSVHADANLHALRLFVGFADYASSGLAPAEYEETLWHFFVDMEQGANLGDRIQTFEKPYRNIWRKSDGSRLWQGADANSGAVVNYMKLTTAGDLTVHNNVYVTNELHVGPYPLNTATGIGGWEYYFWADPNTGDKYQYYRGATGNWYDVWSSATGGRGWVGAAPAGGAQTLMSLDQAGNLLALGNITATLDLVSTLDTSVGRNLAVVGATTLGTTLTLTTGGPIISPTGTVNVTGSLAASLNVSAAGSMSAAAATVSGAMTAGQVNVGTAGTQFYLAPDSGQSLINLGPNTFIQFEGGAVVIVVNGQTFKFDGSGNFTAPGTVNANAGVFTTTVTASGTVLT